MNGTVALNIINVRRVFDDVLIDNNEKIASSKKHIQFKTRLENHTLFMVKMAKIDTLFPDIDQKG